MKKLYLFLFICITASCRLNAQQVYNLVVENATRTVNSPTSGYSQTRIAQFKLTTLTYIRSKAFEQTDTVSSRFLDTQAYYLSEFISLFFDEILKDKKLGENKRKAKVALFMDASLANPLFNDPDDETTKAYVLEGNEITPFSINTDWERAYAAAKSQLK